MDSSAGGAHVGVTLHQVHQLDDGLGLEVDVAVQGQQVRVLSPHLDKMNLNSLAQTFYPCKISIYLFISFYSSKYINVYMCL